MAAGKGISAAVRDSIGEWLTQPLVEVLWYKLENKGALTIHSFRRRLEKEDSWARRKRVRDGSRWKRMYDCKGFSSGYRSARVGLEVYTNAEDTMIQYVAFRLDDRIVGGGKVKVPSVNTGEYVSWPERQIKLDGETATFRPFSADELAALENNMRFGAGSLDALFEDRV